MVISQALYDYTAENREEEIDLLEGDVVAVEYKVIAQVLMYISAFRHIWLGLDGIH